MAAEQILALDPATRSVRPGETASYTLTVKNPTATAVTYALSAQGVPVEWVGLAGSVTTVAAIALGLREYDPARIHHARIPREEVRKITERLLAATHAERAAIPAMHPGRVDVIGAGVLILLAIMERTSAAEVVVSEHDILDGIAYDLAKRS